MVNLTKDDFINVCENSITMAEAAAKLKLHYNTFKRYAIKYGCWKPNQGGKGMKKNITANTITLQDILDTIGDIQIVLVREMTKIHEEKIRGKVSELIHKEPKGEYVLILDLNQKEEKVDFTKMDLKHHYQFYENLGLFIKIILLEFS